MGRPFVLAMTHEETVTYHAREISSYRQLPQILYHFQTKVRDEPRPRAGLIRGAGVRHEGLILVRPGRGRVSSELPGTRARLPTHLRALRARVLRRRGGVGDDGRQRVRGLPGAVRVGREHVGHAARTATTPPTSRSRAAFRAHPSSRSGSTRLSRWRHRARPPSTGLQSSSGSTRPRRRRRCRS